MNTTQPIVFLYPGQGSQYYGMAKDLHDNNEVFRTALRRYDAAIAEELGDSVIDRIHDPAKPKNHPFLDTRITHPGIVMIELALTETLRAEGIEPDLVLGSSLGEYAAAVVAGSIDAIDCLRLLVRQADAVRECPPGGMLAVISGTEVLDRLPDVRACDIAAYNYPGSFVVAGPEADLDRAEAALRAADVLHVRLPVEYGFHSRVLDHAFDACRSAFDGVAFRRPQLPWVSCVDGGVVAEATAEHFWHVARQPIEFERAMAGLLGRGDFLHLDLGPAGTLHNFVGQILPEGSRSESMPLLSQFEKDTELLDKVRARVARKPPREKSKKGEHGMSGNRALKVYGFPGQGSQRRGMGKELFARFPAETAIADDVLGYSIEELCVRDEQRRLGRTEFTQPALYVTGALSYLDRVAGDPTPPDYLVGHSLGEYVALFAAGAFDFATGLRMVRRRGELMAAAADGAMAAVVGVDEDTVTRLLAEPAHNAVDLANYNAADQFVISGPHDDVDAACAAFDAAGATTIRLRVSAALHSRHMRGVAEQFGDFLDGCALRPPGIPVLANVDARPYDADTMKERLTAQIASPVRWTETIRTLMNHGDFEFVELGPGEVLTKLVRRIRGSTEPLPAATSETAASPDTAGHTAPTITAEELGAQTFRDRYGLRRAYAVGSMFGGVSGPELVHASAKAGLLGILGTGGLSSAEVDEQLGALDPGGTFGVNLLHRHGEPEQEAALVDVLLRRGVNLVEASGFPAITESLVRFRLRGGRIVAKVSRTDVAGAFLAPPPEHLVRRLLASGAITPEEAAGASRPMADDLCVEADGGWLSGTGDLLTLLPAVLRLRDDAAPAAPVHVGCAGGLGTPEAVAAAFLLGADFVLTGSVNQCSVEAATSDEVKNLLQEVREHDVDTAPYSDLFELGVPTRYVKRGSLFPARAATLHELWSRQPANTELDHDTRTRILDRYLGGEHPPPAGTSEAKTELAALSRRYFERGFRLAVTGARDAELDYLIHCGPAMGAFNQVVAGTELHPWRARTVEAISDVLMEGAATHILDRVRRFR